MYIAWNQSDSTKCNSLEEYNKMFSKTLLPVTSSRHVPLSEQIEKYCCGLPKDLRDYVTKTTCRNLAQLFENASVAINLQKGAAFHVKNREAATRNDYVTKTTCR